MKINYVIGAFLCVLGCYGCSSPKTEVKSPDGHIKMALTVDDNGKPLYNILVGDSLLIENSTLGFTEKNGIDLGGGFQIKNTTFALFVFPLIVEVVYERMLYDKNGKLLQRRI